MTVLWLAQAVDTQSVFERYGLAGLAVVGMAAAVIALFRQQMKAHDTALSRERDRADRYEAEVRRLNELMHEKVVPVLAEATRSIGDALNFRRRADQ